MDANNDHAGQVDLRASFPEISREELHLIQSWECVDSSPGQHPTDWFSRAHCRLISSIHHHVSYLAYFPGFDFVGFFLNLIAED